MNARKGKLPLNILQMECAFVQCVANDDGNDDDDDDDDVGRTSDANFDFSAHYARNLPTKSRHS